MPSSAPALWQLPDTKPLHECKRQPTRACPRWHKGHMRNSWHLPRLMFWAPEMHRHKGVALWCRRHHASGLFEPTGERPIRLDARPQLRWRGRTSFCPVPTKMNGNFYDVVFAGISTRKIYRGVPGIIRNRIKMATLYRSIIYHAKVTAQIRSL